MTAVTPVRDSASRYRIEPTVLQALRSPRLLTREVLAGLVVALALIPAATAFSNAYAPEHLELHLVEPRTDDYVNAGAVFVGSHTPVSLGDYLAGSNHVLPTGGQARYAAGLGAATFLRSQQVISYDREALRAVHHGILALSDSEQLPAHGEAVSARFDA